MKKALLQHKYLISSVALLSISSISLYLYQFYENGLSGKTENWANFATYLSGTVGVWVIAGTLLSLIQTLHQQGKIIEQQDDLIKSQKNQLTIIEAHQKKNEAYSKIENIFPEFLELCTKERNNNETPVQRFNRYNYEGQSSLFFSKGKHFREFFNPEHAILKYDFKEEVFFLNFWNTYLIKPYNLSELITDCIENSPELKTYIISKLDSYISVVSCTLAFAIGANIEKEKTIKISKTLSLPIDYTSTNSSQEMWQKIGKAQIRLFQEKIESSPQKKSHT